MKLGVIGTGKIVHEALFALSHVDTIELKAIFARPHSADKGKALAEKYGIEQVYTDYAQLLAEADVDAVYIGLVNSAHYGYSKEAMLAGKNVILEKPFTSTLAEAEELIQIAKERNLFILEAITTIHGPIHKKIEELLPKIGTVKVHQGNYSQYSSRYTDYLQGKVAPAFDPEAPCMTSIFTIFTRRSPCTALLSRRFIIPTWALTAWILPAWRSCSMMDLRRR